MLVNIRSFIITFLVLSTTIVPLHAHAGVISFISNLFSDEVSAQEVDVPTQNMALLQAPLSPNVGMNVKSDDLAIVDDTALVYEPVMPGDGKTSSDDQISIYVVRSGDTLPAIAKMFDVTVNTIRWGNDIKGNTISVGQTLIILPISGIQHVVKKGDTLQSIAKQHKGDLDEVMQYNNLNKGSKLIVGDFITVPDGEIVTISPTKPRGGSKKTPVYEGFYLRPIIGGIKTQGLHGKNGVDLASGFGTNILAAASGEVIISKSSGYNGGYGLYVVIKHSNGTQTLYAHLSSVSVGVGEKVGQGDVIGKMGSTGKSTGTHLHFEIRGARNPF